MDWNLFWSILAIGVIFVVVQGICAWFDGYLTQTQMQSWGIADGWSFMEHGGMWADVLIISPLVAYFASNYQLEYFSVWGVIIFLVVLVASLGMGYVYQKAAITTPEAHTHDGKTTLAGWIHCLYAVIAIWTCALVYLDMVSPSVSKQDLVGLTTLLTPFFFLGVVKFNQRWVFTKEAKYQVAIEIFAVWALTLFRLYAAS